MSEVAGLIDQIEVGGGSSSKLLHGKYLDIDKNDYGVTVYDVLQSTPREDTFNLTINKDESYTGYIQVFYVNLKIKQCSDSFFELTENKYGHLPLSGTDNKVSFTIEGIDESTFGTNLPMMVFILSDNMFNVFNSDGIKDIVFLNVNSA